MVDKGLYKKVPAAKSQLVYESNKRLGYRGDDAARSDRASDRDAGRADPGNAPQGDGPATGGRSNDTLPSNIPTSDNKTFTISTDPMDLKEQYRVGNVPTSVTGVPSFVTFDDPFSSQALETQRYSNYLDSRNLANMNYPGVTGKVPAFIPYSGVINTGINLLSGIIGSPGFEKNKDFFADNVAGKYGYGYGYDDYKEYMQDRMAGKVNAYGRTLNNAERGGNDNNIGIASIQPIIPLTADQEPEEETPMTDYERYQSYLQNFFGGI